MGKASRARSARQAVEEIKRQEQEMLLRQKKKKTITNIVVAAVSVLLCAVFIGTVIFLNAAKTNGSLLRNKVAIKSDNFEISGTTFTYFLNYQYTDFVKSYSDRLSSYGLDPEVDLRQQESSDGQNWFDYMAQSTKANLTEILYLAEKATSEGMKLSESELKQIDDFIADLEKYAKESDLDVTEYIYTAYGQGVNKEDIRKGLEISTLATKYYSEKIDTLTYTDDEINEYFEGNSVDFQMVDYKYYNFAPNVTEDMSEDEAKAEYQRVKDYAERLSKATSSESFDSILKEILKERGVTDTNIESAVENSSIVGNTYDEEFDVSVWAYDAEAKVNSTYIYPSGNSRAVYMLTKKPYRDESETRSVRHILISSDSYESDQEAKAKAQEVLDEYNKGDKTAESFGKLAEKYTEDLGSASTGGLYENFTKGTMVEPFENWSFDEARKEGDTGIVKTDYGYHIMYFVSEGNPVWKNTVIQVLKDSAYEALYKKLEETYAVELNEGILKDIPTIKIKNSAASTTN